MALLTFLLAFAAMAQSPPMRAVQISILDFKSRAQLQQWFKQLQAAGINTVIIKVFQNPGDGFHGLCPTRVPAGVYFQTEAAPVVCDLTGIVAEDAHRAGLKFYAWMDSRYADYGWEGRTDLHSLYYDLESSSYKTGRGLCIFHPEVKARLLHLYYDLARYPIDGVLVQDDLMLKHNEDFSPLAVHQYLKERGQPVSPERFYLEIKNEAGKKVAKDYTPEFREWNDWKTMKLLDLADELRAALRRQRPGVKFGCNFYYETALKPDKGKEWFSQDLKMAAGRNYDFYALMLYHRQLGEELHLSGPDLDSALELAGKNFLALIPGNGAPLFKLMTKDFNNSEPIPVDELKRVIKLIPQRDRAGLALFPSEAGQETLIPDIISTWGTKDEKNSSQRPDGRGDPGGVQKGKP